MSTKTMVCRCEDVTLDEVRRALAEGHDDMESLKRYTGFGTGCDDDIDHKAIPISSEAALASGHKIFTTGPDAGFSSSVALKSAHSARDVMSDWWSHNSRT
jgi:bacterioferritin-associated ferredoxin